MAKLTHEDGPFPYKISLNEGERGIEMPLEMYPDIAMRIGIFLAHFAMAETLTQFLLMAVTSLSDSEARIVLGTQQSYGCRLEMIEQLLKQRKKGPGTHALLTLVSELKWLNSTRNQYAHALYGAGRSPASLMLFPFHADTTRRITELEIDEEDVALHTIRAKRLLCAMQTILFVPPEHWDVDILGHISKP